jgi:hypothetical protein
MNEQEDEMIEKIDGRTRAGRAARATVTESRGSAPRGLEARRMVRGEVLGRNGEVLSRKRSGTADIFDIPQEIVPKGWQYQWCAASVLGNTEVLMDQNLMFAENGWRPVPCERHEGRFMPVGHKGSIMRGGQMLMERPAQLCEEARQEELQKARQQMQDRDQSLMGRDANLRASMKDGFTMGGRYRGTGGDIRLSVDPALDIPVPQHEIAGRE